PASPGRAMPRGISAARTEDGPSTDRMPHRARGIRRLSRPLERLPRRRSIGTVPRAMVIRLGALVAVAVAATVPPALPRSFALFDREKAGGTLWQGVIPNSYAPSRRTTVVYLPPGHSTAGRYPVVVLLQGFPGSPYEYSSGLRIADVADAEIAAGSVRPFV